MAIIERTPVVGMGNVCVGKGVLVFERKKYILFLICTVIIILNISVFYFLSYYAL